MHRTVAITACLILVAASVVADPADTSVENLRQQLEASNAAIRSLQQRLDELERRLQASEARTPGSDAAAASTGVAVAAVSPEPSPTTPERSGAVPGQVQAEPERQQAEASDEPASESAPGSFEVDKDAAERALERTLTAAGVLLLPAGIAEFEPSFAYTRQELSMANEIFQSGSSFFAGTDKIRRDVFDADIRFRFGLPYDSQLEFRLPYRWVDRDDVTEVGVFGPRAVDSDSGSGFGDFSVGLAKTLLREDRWWPDLVGRVTWDTGTGKKDDGGVLLGGGFDELSVSLSAVKRQDPLAFVGGLSYSHTFEDDDVKPGREIGLSLGTALAASPSTSLRAVLGQTFGNELRVNGSNVQGTDRVVGQLTLGASSIIAPGMLLDFSTDVGLTDDAPDYSFRVSLSTRFDFPNF